MAAEGKDAKGRFLPGHSYSKLPPGEGRRKRGHPKKGEEVNLGARFVEDMIIHKYRTSWGVWNAIDEIWDKLPATEQAKLHLRMMELYQKTFPKKLQVENDGLVVRFELNGVRDTGPRLCAKCGGPIEALPAPIDITPAPAPLPQAGEGTDHRLYQRPEPCEAVRDFRAERAGRREEYEEAIRRRAVENGRLAVQAKELGIPAPVLPADPRNDPKPREWTDADHVTEDPDRPEWSISGRRIFRADPGWSGNVPLPGGFGIKDA